MVDSIWLQNEMHHFHGRIFPSLCLKSLEGTEEYLFYATTYFPFILWFFCYLFIIYIQLCVFVGLFDSYHHLGSSCVSYTSANGIQNTSKASIRKFHRSQVYIDHSIFLLLSNFNFNHRMPCTIYQFPHPLAPRKNAHTLKKANK